MIGCFILDLSRFLLLPQQPQKIQFTSKVTQGKNNILVFLAEIARPTEKIQVTLEKADVQVELNYQAIIGTSGKETLLPTFE